VQSQFWADVASGAITPVLDTALPMDQAEEARQRLEAAATSAGSS